MPTSPWPAATLLPILLLLLSLVPAHPARATDPGEHWYTGRLEVGTGFDYREGDYGRSRDTEIFYVPFLVSHRFKNLAFRDRDRVQLDVTVPWLQVHGPERGPASSPRARGTDSGLGDVLVGASYYVVPSGRRLPVVRLSGKLKIPTASTRRDLGTGKLDFTPSLLISQRFPIAGASLLRSFNPFASIGYQLVGDPDRNHAWRASAGASLRVGQRFAPGLRYSFQQSTIPGRGDSHILSPFLGIRVTPWLRLTPYGTFGLSTRSPDWGAGLLLRFTRWIP